MAWVSFKWINLTLLFFSFPCCIIPQGNGAISSTEVIIISTNVPLIHWSLLPNIQSNAGTPSRNPQGSSQNSPLYQLAFFFQQQQIPLLSHHSLTSPALTSRSSPTRPRPSTFSQEVRSSRIMGSYMRIFSCHVAWLRLDEDDEEESWEGRG